jgi:hypothetical protein
MQPGLRRELGIAGTIRTVEATYGSNGWHPHVHAVILFDRDQTAKDLVKLRRYVRTHWAAFVEKYCESAGLSGRVCGRAGVELRRVKGIEGVDHVLAYVAKLDDTSRWGNELVRFDLKTGAGSLTPFEVGLLAAKGNSSCEQLWQEYEAVTLGKRCVQFSQGLRVKLGLDATDNENADTPEINAVLGYLPWTAHKRLGGNAGRLLDLVEDLFAREGVEAAVQWLVRSQPEFQPRN